MTARDEAITVINEQWPNFDAEVILPLMLDMLGPLLAQLAIEQGGLEPLVVETAKASDETLYRVVEP